MPETIIFIISNSHSNYHEMLSITHTRV